MCRRTLWDDGQCASCESTRSRRGHQAWAAPSSAAHGTSNGLLLKSRLGTTLGSAQSGALMRSIGGAARGRRSQERGSFGKSIWAFKARIWTKIGATGADLREEAYFEGSGPAPGTKFRPSPSPSNEFGAKFRTTSSGLRDARARHPDRPPIELPGADTTMRDRFGMHRRYSMNAGHCAGSKPDVVVVVVADTPARRQSAAEFCLCEADIVVVVVVLFLGF